MLAGDGPLNCTNVPTWLQFRDHGFLAIASKTIPTTDYEHVLFVLPKGGVEVSPGQLYSLQLSGGPTFGWNHVVGGYEKGNRSTPGQLIGTR